jgi:ribosomal protein S18 acetylase RimI-like enzyme
MTSSSTTDIKNENWPMTMRETELTIREFEAGDEAAFRSLNEEWIRRYFVIEPKDEASFADPRGSILDRGGRIFFAVQDRQPVGCCALLSMESGGFEVAKMAVSESYRGNGIGRRLLEKAVAEARAAGAHRLYLETNKKMQPAIRLYESIGFRHVPSERIVPSPYSRANVYMELYFDGVK